MSPDLLIKRAPETMIKQPHLLTELIFAPDQILGQEDSVTIPVLRDQGIVHAISIGPSSKNMAEGFEKDNIPAVIARQQAFLAKNGLSPLEDAFLGLVPKNPTDPHVLFITEEMIETARARPIYRADPETDVRAECLLTTRPGIPLLIKPADCATAIIKATTGQGKALVGVAHLGRPQVNRRTVEEMLTILGDLGCDPKQIFVGIAPSIGPVHYTLTEDDLDVKKLLDLTYWEGYMDRDEIDPKLYHVDVLGKILSLLKEGSIPTGNIQAYGHEGAVDTYHLASLTPPQALSSRFATSTNQPERNGRILVAAQLPKDRDIL